MSEVVASPASDVKPEVKTNISIAELTFQRSQQRVQQAEAAKTAAEAKPEAVTAEPEAKPAQAEEAHKEGATEAKAEETKGKEVLSQPDLTELSDEDIQELAQRGKSGLLKRIAELTAKRKLAEAEAARLQQILAQQAQVPEAKVENNPFSSIESVDALNTKFKEISEVIEWAEDTLDRATDMASDEQVAVIEGKPLTKADVREHLKRARRAKEKYLPAQFRELQAKAQRQALRSAFETQARQELPWLEGEDNDLKKTYQAMISDPRLKKLEDAIPELAPQIGYIVAHAANSMYARKSLSLDSKPAAKVTPPSSPSADVSIGDRTDDRGTKVVKETAKRMHETGSFNDFVALRTAQLSKRKNLK